MQKRNPKSYSENLDRGQPVDQVINTNGDRAKETGFKPFYYELDDLLKDITPDKMQEEISTGPSVGKEVF